MNTNLNNVTKLGEATRNAIRHSILSAQFTDGIQFTPRAQNVIARSLESTARGGNAAKLLADIRALDGRGDLTIHVPGLIAARESLELTAASTGPARRVLNYIATYLDQYEHNGTGFNA